MANQFPTLSLEKGCGRGRRLAVVAARFNLEYTGRLLESCLSRLESLGLERSRVRVEWVPGAFELPLAAKALASTGRFEAVVCLGAVLRGETSHYDLVCAEAARGVSRAALDTGVPVIFGVITCENRRQALARCGGGPKDAGLHAASAALWMASLMGRLGRRGKGA